MTNVKLIMQFVPKDRPNLVVETVKLLPSGEPYVVVMSGDSYSVYDWETYQSLTNWEGLGPPE